MGFSLNYYNTSTTADYKPIKTFTTSDVNPLMSVSGFSVSSNPFYLDDNSANLAGDGPDLFNGNIGSMNTAFIDKDPSNLITDNSPFPQLTAYRYDQLQRLTKMKSFRSYSASTLTWNPANSTNYDDAYKMGLSYDYNGNILSLTRNGPSTLILSGASLSMDNLSYSYYNTSVGTISGTNNIATPYNSNKLRCVTDAVSSTNYSDDIDNVPCDSYDYYVTDYGGGVFSNSAGNRRYAYDEIGNLLWDRGEYIKQIDWTVDRKVKRIWRDSVSLAGAGITKPDIAYEYNSQRQRVVKVVMPRDLSTGTLTPAQNWVYTYYVYDASGNVLATYNRSAAQVSGSTYKDNLSLKENPIYGSSRLAMALNSNTNIAWSYNFNAACSTSTGYCRGIPTTSITPATTLAASGYTLARNLGYKDLELTNHLGNVITTVSDRKLLEFGNPVVNDDFTSSLDSWGSCTLIAGQAVITTSVQYAAATKNFTTVPGRLYRIRYTTSIPTGAQIQAEVYPVPIVPPFITNVAAVSGTNELSFIATSAVSLLRILKANAPGTSITYSIDNVIIDQPSGYHADLVSNTDYYPFGQKMPGRNWTGGDSYRYGMNGQEHEDETFVGAYSAEYWEYDSRIGRRWNVDPITYEGQSPYATFDNNPIFYADPSGAEAEAEVGGAVDGDDKNGGGGKTKVDCPTCEGNPGQQEALKQCPTCKSDGKRGVIWGGGEASKTPSGGSKNPTPKPKKDTPAAPTGGGGGVATGNKPNTKTNTGKSNLISAKNAVWETLEKIDYYVDQRTNLPDNYVYQGPIKTNYYGDTEHGEGATHNENFYGNVEHAGDGTTPGALLYSKGKAGVKIPETHIGSVLENFANIGEASDYAEENAEKLEAEKPAIEVSNSGNVSVTVKKAQVLMMNEPLVTITWESGGEGNMSGGTESSTKSEYKKMIKQMEKQGKRITNIQFEKR